MSSPFPGMDPYLEDPAFWSDFHVEFIVCMRRALNQVLPDNYEASINERTALVEASLPDTRVVLPDLAVTRRDGASYPAAQVAGGVAIEPISVPILSEEEVREVWIEIYHRPERDLVAVLELLSPSNKAGSGRAEYLAKRRAVLRQSVHLVELDLLVGGQRIVTAPLPRGDYVAIVARAHRRPDGEVYAWSVRSPLPKIPVPLQAPDPDVPLDLQAAFSNAYEGARYGRRIDYDRPLQAPLAEDDRQWAQQRVRRP